MAHLKSIITFLVASVTLCGCKKALNQDAASLTDPPAANAAPRISPALEAELTGILEGRITEQLNANPSLPTASIAGTTLSIDSMRVSVSDGVSRVVANLRMTVPEGSVVFVNNITIAENLVVEAGNVVRATATMQTRLREISQRVADTRAGLIQEQLAQEAVAATAPDLAARISTSFELGNELRRLATTSPEIGNLVEGILRRASETAERERVTASQRSVSVGATERVPGGSTIPEAMTAARGEIVTELGKLRAGLVEQSPPGPNGLNYQLDMRLSAIDGLIRKLRVVPGR